jgi:hypothetical protein
MPFAANAQGYSTCGDLLHCQFATESYICGVIDFSSTLDVILSLVCQSSAFGELIGDGDVEGVRAGAGAE